MEWTKVNVLNEGDGILDGQGIDVPKYDLDMDAEAMHDEFLKNIPHLSEVQEKHAEVTSEINFHGLEWPKSTIEELVSEFGGEWSESATTITLPIEFNARLSLETMDERDGQKVRLISPERFGGLMRTFRLPPGKEIAGAEWRDEGLRISLDSHHPQNLET